MYSSLVDFRNIKGLKQKEMADKLDITLSYYSKIEIGLRSPSYNFIKKFKKIFPEANVDTIFFNL